jgi:hypothetical protein
VGGTSGTVVLTSLTTTGVSGTYDITFGTQGSYKGSFDVSFCAVPDAGHEVVSVGPDAAIPKVTCIQ